jgi:hypothetical protein
MVHESSVSRAAVLEIVKSASNALRAARASPDDAAAVARALAEACAAAGVSAAAFDAAVAADADLEQLETAALREAVAGGADPGPYAEISRESMSGKPGDTTKSRTNSEP